MPIMLNTILQAENLDMENVRLLRHQDNRATKGYTPYELWRDNRQRFDIYQSTQEVRNAPKLNGLYWVSFVGTPYDETLFVGVYRIRGRKLLEIDTPKPHRPGVDKAESCYIYDLELQSYLDDLIGRMLIDWGAGARAWIQRADKQNKPIIELRSAFKEPGFPGFLQFIKPVAQLDRLPHSWITALQSAKGVYLLTCPKTQEQYVGSATGESGFWGRWQDYLQTGHGGNVALKSRNSSDYQVSILEVAGTSSTVDDILKMEALWKSKLQSIAMGLNRN